MQFVKAPVFHMARASSVDFDHQLLLLPLRKEQNSENKQINNTCRGTDKALQRTAFDAAALN